MFDQAAARAAAGCNGNEHDGNNEHGCREGMWSTKNVFVHWSKVFVVQMVMLREKYIEQAYARSGLLGRRTAVGHAKEPDSARAHGATSDTWDGKAAHRTAAGSRARAEHKASTRTGHSIQQMA